jgi:hypothetical protein
VKPLDLEALKAELGLTGVDDPEMLKAAIRERLAE